MRDYESKLDYGALQSLDARSQAALASIIAGELRAVIAPSGIGLDTADYAISAMKRWVGGERVPAEYFSDLIHDNDDKGSDVYAQISQGYLRSAWNSLSSGLFYVAYQAHLEQESPMGSDVCEVSEDTLHHMFDKWKETPCFDRSLWDRAIQALRQRNPANKNQAIDVDAVLAEIRSM